MTEGEGQIEQHKENWRGRNDKNNTFFSVLSWLNLTIYSSFFYPSYTFVPLSCSFSLKPAPFPLLTSSFSAPIPSPLSFSPTPSPLVAFESSKAGSGRANSRWTRSNTQLCHLLRSHDWAAKPRSNTMIPHHTWHIHQSWPKSSGEWRKLRMNGNQEKNTLEPRHLLFWYVTVMFFSSQYYKWHF